jgi:hypothetical protein
VALRNFGFSSIGTGYKIGFIFLSLVVLAAAFAGPAVAEDLYVNASAPSNGSGSLQHPYWRITDAVTRARNDRRNAVIPLAETITIHVAPGTYIGSFFNTGPHIEPLPIVLNVPNLVIQGSTALDLDSGGLPYRVAKNTAQSVLAADADLNDYTAALITITRTTDGSAGDWVTVTGFTLHVEVDFQGVLADHVSHFRIMGNSIDGAFLNIYTRAATGTIEGNLLSHSDTIGCLSEGGTGQFPSQVSVIGNRINSNEDIGVIGVTYPSDFTLNLGQSGLSSLPFQFGGSHPDMPNGLNLTLAGNDISDNAGAGIRLFVAPFVPNAQAILGAGSPTLLANIVGNTINRNQQYGLVVDGGDAPLGFAPYSGTVLVSLLANSIARSGVQPALFTFYNFFDTIAGPQENEYLQQALYHIFDLDRELTSFDYDNPVLDPATNGPLHDRLLVNNSGNVLGVKLSLQP